MLPILWRRLRDVVRVQCYSDLEQGSERSAGSRLPRPGEGLCTERAQWSLMSSTGKFQGQEVTRVSVRAWRTRRNVVVVPGGQGVSGCLGRPPSPPRRACSAPPLTLPPCIMMCVALTHTRNGRACSLLCCTRAPAQRLCSLCVY